MPILIAGPCRGTSLRRLPAGISRDIVHTGSRWVMEKNKLIIQSITQGKLTPAQAAEHFGVSRRWVYELMRRHRVSGEDGVLPLSRRPHSSPQQTAETVRSRILSLRPELTDKGLDAGAETIAWHLSVEGLAVPAASTIHRILRSAGWSPISPTNAHGPHGTSSKQHNPMRCGSQISLTGPWQVGPMWRS